MCDSRICFQYSFEGMLQVPQRITCLTLAFHAQWVDHREQPGFLLFDMGNCVVQASVGAITWSLVGGSD